MAAGHRRVTLLPPPLEREEVRAGGGQRAPLSGGAGRPTPLRVLPRRALVLEADAERGAKGELILVNESAWRCAAFKVKTNAASMYRVSPSHGVVQPGEGAVVRVALVRPVPETGGRLPKHVFQVHSRQLVAGRHARAVDFNVAYNELAQEGTHVSKRRAVLSRTPERRRWAAKKAQRASGTGGGALPPITTAAGEQNLAPEEQEMLEAALADAARRAADPSPSGSDASGAPSDDSDDELLELALNEERRWKRLVGVRRDNGLGPAVMHREATVVGLGVDEHGAPQHVDPESAAAARRGLRDSWKSRMAAELWQAPSRDAAAPATGWKHALALHLASVDSAPMAPPQRQRQHAAPPPRVWLSRRETRSESASPVPAYTPPPPQGHSRFLLPAIDGMSAADRHALEMALEAEDHDFHHPWGPNAPGIRNQTRRSIARSDSVEDGATLGGAEAECLICFDRVADAIIVPCGHAEYCGACLAVHARKNGRVCPTCRTEFEATELKDFG